MAIYILVNHHPMFTKVVTKALGYRDAEFSEVRSGTTAHVVLMYTSTKWLRTR